MAAKSSSLLLWLPVFVVLVVAALLRLPGLFTDLWMDEIWSFKRRVNDRIHLAD